MIIWPGAEEADGKEVSANAIVTATVDGEVHVMPPLVAELGVQFEEEL